MSICTKTEAGIDLTNIPRNLMTNELFEAANQFGNPKALSEVDTRIWAVYQTIYLEDKVDKYPKCSSKESCFSTDFISVFPYSPLDLRSKPWQRGFSVPESFFRDKERQIEQRANRFLEDAKMLLKKMKMEPKQIELPFEGYCPGESRGACP